MRCEIKIFVVFNRFLNRKLINLFKRKISVKKICLLSCIELNTDVLLTLLIYVFFEGGP